jgi:hypothetical protein
MTAEYFRFVVTSRFKRESKNFVDREAISRKFSIDILLVWEL